MACWQITIDQAHKSYKWTILSQRCTHVGIAGYLSDELWDFVRLVNCMSQSNVQSLDMWAPPCDIQASLEIHHSDVIMGAMASQITSLIIVYSTVYSSSEQRKHQSSASLVTGEFPAQNTSNVENASIWWLHHKLVDLIPLILRLPMKWLMGSRDKWTSRVNYLYWFP